MAVPTQVLQSILTSGRPYVIYRADDQADPTTAPLFYPPKDSDELFDALRSSFPHLKTHSERMRDAIIDFLLEEREAQRNKSHVVSCPTSSTLSEYPSSLLSTPNMQGSTNSISTNSSPNMAPPRTLREPSIAVAGQNSPLSLDQMTGVFCLSSASNRRQKMRRKMTETEKIEYRKRRIVKACDSCAKRKRKCHHNQSEADVACGPSNHSGHRISKPSISSTRSTPPSLKPPETQAQCFLAPSIPTLGGLGFDSFSTSITDSMDDVNPFADTISDSDIENYFRFDDADFDNMLGVTQPFLTDTNYAQQKPISQASMHGAGQDFTLFDPQTTSMNPSDFAEIKWFDDLAPDNTVWDDPDMTTTNKTLSDTESALGVDSTDWSSDECTNATSSTTSNLRKNGQSRATSATEHRQWNMKQTREAMQHTHSVCSEQHVPKLTLRPQDLDRNYLDISPSASFKPGFDMLPASPHQLNISGIQQFQTEPASSIRRDNAGNPTSVTSSGSHHQDVTRLSRPYPQPLADDKKPYPRFDPDTSHDNAPATRQKPHTAGAATDGSSEKRIGTELTYASPREPHKALQPNTAMQQNHQPTLGEPLALNTKPLMELRMLRRRISSTRRNDSLQINPGNALARAMSSALSTHGIAEAESHRNIGGSQSSSRQTRQVPSPILLSTRRSQKETQRVNTSSAATSGNEQTSIFNMTGVSTADGPVHTRSTNPADSDTGRNGSNLRRAVRAFAQAPPMNTTPTDITVAPVHRLESVYTELLSDHVRYRDHFGRTPTSPARFTAIHGGTRSPADGTTESESSQFYEREVCRRVDNILCLTLFYSSLRFVFALCVLCAAICNPPTSSSLVFLPLLFISSDNEVQLRSASAKVPKLSSCAEQWWAKWFGRPHRRAFYDLDQRLESLHVSTAPSSTPVPAPQWLHGIMYPFRMAPVLFAAIGPV